MGSKTRRRIVMLSLAVVLLAVGFYQESRKRNSESASESARLDRGIPAEGQRGSIDPHGPAKVEPLEQSLQIEAKVLSSTPQGAKLQIQIAATEAFDPLEVTAERYGAGEVVTADWTAPVWSGALPAGTPRTIDFDVPYGSAVPSRVRIAARATSAAGGRLSASAIVRQSDLEPKH